MKIHLVLALAAVVSAAAAAAVGKDDVSEYHDIALRFAPRIRFDQKTGDTLGECLPGDAEDYYHLRKGGFQGRICNLDYISIPEGRVPAYYQVQKCGDNFYMSYWIFYGFKDDCPFASDGGDVSWGRFIVKATNNGTSLDRVIFYQFEGWYTRNPGHYDIVEGTHPVAFAGKLRHGHYHDDGGSGTCCYYEDYRNTGTLNKQLDTWKNMVWLRKNGTSPEWMNNNDPYFWNGVPLPTFRDQDLCDLRGCTGSGLQVCGTCGCHKSDVHDNQIP